jgi:uncharacterized protein YlxP (DUF503 family)
MVRIFSLIGVVTLLTLTGCTRSLELTYTPSAAKVTAADKAAAMSFGVARLEDKRSWVDATDSKGQSYIAQQGAWKFGLTHEGREFVPVNEVLQSLFVTELRTAGFPAKPLDGIASKQAASQLRELGRQAGTEYAIGGEILVFEFVNEDKVWTVTSRRAVTLNLLIVRTQDGQPVVDSTYSELNREGEGMGVLHSTNVDKLFHGAFKTVVQRVIEEVARKLEVTASAISVRLVAGAPVDGD